MNVTGSIKHQQLRVGAQRMPRCEEHRKAVCVNSACTVITVLAYQFVQLIRRQLKKSDDNFSNSWRTLREILSTQNRVTVSFRRADGTALHVRKATKAEPEQMDIYKAL